MIQSRFLKTNRSERFNICNGCFIDNKPVDLRRVFGSFSPDKRSVSRELDSHVSGEIDPGSLPWLPELKMPLSHRCVAMSRLLLYLGFWDPQSAFSSSFDQYVLLVEIAWGSTYKCVVSCSRRSSNMNISRRFARHTVASLSFPGLWLRN